MIEQMHCEKTGGSRLLLQAIAVGVALLFGSVSETAAGQGEEEITIEHIAEGIRKHIEERSYEDGGEFLIKHDGKLLELKLIRIHMEYLANLGGGVQFACVDLVESDGTVYDVDFFMKGTHPDALSVTETHVHKLDGRPLYAWGQKDDGTWHRVAVEEATEDLLGVIKGEDEFEFLYRYQIPELDAPAQLWLPFPQSDAWQTVSVADMRVPGPWRLLEETAYGNTVLYLEPKPEHSGDVIEIRYHVRRKERSPYEAYPNESVDRHLAPERLVPINETFRALAKSVVPESGTALMRAREIYNHTVETIRYARYGDGWGRGDAVYACDVQSGNCSDFHSYFIALARAAGIPARYISGAAIPSERDDGGVDGYHCWAEFHADGRWWPVDISEANKYTTLADYYFGRNPANRFELSRGRDLIVNPHPQSGPINFLAYPILEINGEAITARPEFAFRRSPARTRN